MIIEFKCKCGNSNPSDAYEYSGMLGYEAIVCTVCGAYSDYTGWHYPDEWSMQYIKNRMPLHPVHEGEKKDEGY
jgi:hypothetical protein